MARGLILHLPLDSRPKHYNYLEHNSIVSMLCHTSFKDWPNAILHIKLSHSYIIFLYSTTNLLITQSCNIIFSGNSYSLPISLQYHCLLLLFVYPTWNGGPMVQSLCIVVFKEALLFYVSSFPLTLYFKDSKKSRYLLSKECSLWRSKGQLFKCHPIMMTYSVTSQLEH